MNKRLSLWLARLWQPVSKETLQAYNVTFSGYHGQIVLQHLFDSVYCQVYEGDNDRLAAIHEGRRSLIQEILQNLDRVKHPSKYEVQEEAGATNG